MIAIDTAEFDRIQRALGPLWSSMASLTPDEQTIVVLPSLSMDLPPGIGHLLPLYEERFMFLLFLLRQPRARMVFLTSRPVPQQIVDYYLGLLPGVIPSHARARLHLLSPDDGSDAPLTQKVLDRPELVQTIAALVPDTKRAHIIPYVTTDLEQALAICLEVPIYGADPRFRMFGTKTGARRLFAECRVPHPAGVESVRTLDEGVEALERLLRDNPKLQGAIIKHDEGVSGLGNATVDLHDVERTTAAVRARVEAAHIPAGSFEQYMQTLARHGGVVEERLAGATFTSPSVQMRVTPLGELEVLSTHDQVLGGPDGQIYEGCRFPADPAYARAITKEAVKVGERLAREGVIGRFALDFVVVDGRPYAIELNLRKGGTTHPYLSLQFLTDGRYDAETAEFVTPSGARKHLIASDHVEHESYRGMTVDDLFDVIVCEGMHFDQSRHHGVVLHSMSGVAHHGRFGLTAVGDSPDEAAELFARARAALLERARGIRENHR